MNEARRGHLILISVKPENETVVVGFLAGLFKKATRETLTAHVRKAPAVLAKGIPEPQARKIVARLIQLGAAAEFKAATSAHPPPATAEVPPPEAARAESGIPLSEAVPDSKGKRTIEIQPTKERESSGSITIFIIGILVGTPLVLIAGFILQGIVGISIGVPLACIFLSWWICDRMITGSAKHLVPAFSLQAGKGLWSLLAILIANNYIELLDLVILAAGLTWLLKRPGFGSVIYLTIYQAINFCYILYRYSHTSATSAWASHLIIAGTSIYLLFDGYRKIKQNYPVQNDKTSIEKIKRVLINPKYIVGGIIILILLKAIASAIAPF